jgi:Fur family ferric uptake transcriptional regulator
VTQAAKKKKETRGAPVAPSIPSVSDLKATLRAAGLRSTAPRIAALRYLYTSGAPTSHGELFDAVSNEGFDRATLYRNLIDLADAGILTRTDLGDHVWRFELRRDASHSEDHPHFICIDCGEISCLPGVAVTVTKPAVAPRSISKRQVEVQIKGRCDTCR